MTPDPDRTARTPRMNSAARQLLNLERDLRESLRGGYLFGNFDEPLDDELETYEHSLTLKFRRVLTESEWRDVVEKARILPFVQELEANARQAPRVPDAPDLLTKAIADRDSRPWRYYRFECDELKKWCEKVADERDSLRAALAAGHPSSTPPSVPASLPNNDQTKPLAASYPSVPNGGDSGQLLKRVGAFIESRRRNSKPEYEALYADILNWLAELAAVRDAAPASPPVDENPCQRCGAYKVTLSESELDAFGKALSAIKARRTPVEPENHDQETKASEAREGEQPRDSAQQREGLAQNEAGVSAQEMARSPDARSTVAGAAGRTGPPLDPEPPRQDARIKDGIPWSSALQACGCVLYSQDGRHWRNPVCAGHHEYDAGGTPSRAAVPQGGETPPKEK